MNYIDCTDFNNTINNIIVVIIVAIINNLHIVIVINSNYEIFITKIILVSCLQQFDFILNLWIHLNFKLNPLNFYFIISLLNFNS